MNDVELHAALEARGYAKEHNGGNTFIYRKGLSLSGVGNRGITIWTAKHKGNES